MAGWLAGWLGGRRELDGWVGGEGWVVGGAARGTESKVGRAIIAVDVASTNSEVVRRSCVHRHARMHVCAGACVRTCMCARMRACMRVRMHACPRACVPACVRARVHACLHACMHVGIRPAVCV